MRRGGSSPPADAATRRESSILSYGGRSSVAERRIVDLLMRVRVLRFATVGAMPRSPGPRAPSGHIGKLGLRQICGSKPKW